MARRGQKGHATIGGAAFGAHRPLATARQVHPCLDGGREARLPNPQPFQASPVSFVVVVVVVVAAAVVVVVVVVVASTLGSDRRR